MIKFFRFTSILACILLVSGCSFIASRIIPLNDIKSPTGNYKVGTQIFYWVDQDREEWFTEVEGDKRELIVQVWYPSSESDIDEDNFGEGNFTLIGMTFPGNSKSITPINNRDPWMDNSSQRTESIIDNFKVPKFIAKAVDRIDTDAFTDSAPLSEGNFPVIIFSHGFEGFRSQNTTQIQELVSNGYIVFSLDHTYDAVLTIFPDGRKISAAKRYCKECEPEEFYSVFLPQINTRIADVRFLINQIEKIKIGKIESNFSHIMDIDRLGVFGHSFGGGTSLAVSILDSRVQSCLSLDGWYVPIHPDVYNQGLSVPFLHLGQVQWDEKNNYEILDKILKSKENVGYKLSLIGAHHYDFTDSPHLSKFSSTFKLSSDLDSEEILDVTNTTVLGFFDEHLKSKETNWIDKLKKNVNTKIEEFHSNEK